MDEASNQHKDGLQSLQYARELEMPREEGHNLRIMGEIALAQGQIDPAENYLQESYTILNQANDEYESARTQLALVQVSLAQHEYAQGLALLDLCTVTFERLQASLDLANVQNIRASFPK